MQACVAGDAQLIQRNARAALEVFAGPELERDGGTAVVPQIKGDLSPTTIESPWTLPNSLGDLPVVLKVKEQGVAILWTSDIPEREHRIDRPVQVDAG